MQPSHETGSLLTVEQAAKRLNVSRSYVYKMMDASHLPFVQLGRLRRIDADDLERFIASQRKGAA